MPRAQCRGGAADGASVTAAPGLRYLDPRSTVAYKRPAEGRYPYVLGESGYYEPIFICEGCGSWIDIDEQGNRPNPCTLCGYKRGASTDGERHDPKEQGSGEGS